MPANKSLADWFDERLGTREIGRALFGRKIPQASGPVAWVYTLGSVVMFLFVVQAATGVFLAMNYVPAPDHAYDSVRYISEQAPLGDFVRGLHHWGASAMVVAIVLHLLTVLLTAGYKYPREMSWVTGVFLLVIVLFFGFTGYLLPWNEKAYWATLVGTNITIETPLVGAALGRLLRGSAELGPQTLTRFYALHVLLLPALLVMFVAVHLFMVVRQGISAPPHRREPMPEGVEAQRALVAEQYHAAKEAGESFYPFYLAKDVAAVLVVFAALALVAWRFPAGVGQFPDPTDTNYNPRPEWYFLFLFQFLKYFPGKLEPVAAVVIPAAGIIALILLPFVDRKMIRHPLHRPLVSIGAGCAMVGVIALTVLGALSPQVSPYVPEPPQVAEGQRLFRQLHCEYCHSVNGEGGAVGPDLALSTHVEHDEQWVLSHLERPEGVVQAKGTSPMGVLPALTEDQREFLLAYIEELRGGGPYSPLAPELFKAYCTGCHRLHGVGGTFGPDLSSIGLTRSVSFISQYIENPKQVVGSAQMPSFLTPAGPLTHPLIEDLAKYLAAQRGAPAGGTTGAARQ